MTSAMKLIACSRWPSHAADPTLPRLCSPLPSEPRGRVAAAGNASPSSEEVAAWPKPPVFFP
jgi:hypothetical protein